MASDSISHLDDVPDGTPGKPCWVDLATPNPQVSRDFYAALFAWEYRVRPDGYVMAYLDDTPVAGLYSPPDGRQSLWTLYLTVHDTASTADRVEHFGGRVVTPPHEVPGQGSLLLATDPSGGQVGFWRQTSGWQLGTGFPGAFTWAELNTRDAEAADAFFVSLFGYHRHQLGDGVEFDYTTWSVDEEDVLGRLRMGREFPRTQDPHWMVWFELDPAVGADRAAALTLDHGGKVAVAPFNSPYGRTTVLEDPTGAVFTALDRSFAEEIDVEDPNEDPYDD